MAKISAMESLAMFRHLLTITLRIGEIADDCRKKIAERYSVHQEASRFDMMANCQDEGERDIQASLVCYRSAERTAHGRTALY